MTPPIAILGAGPSGLMLGRLLELADIDYTIFERERTPFEFSQGGSLDIHAGSGQLAIREAGLFEDFKKHIRYDSPTTIADKNGNIAASYQPDSDGGESDRPEIDRKDLREVLLKSVAEGTIRWGRRVEELVRDEEGKIRIYFEDGDFESDFKLVIGADGAWSKARSLVTPAVPVYSGIQYFTTVVNPYDAIQPAVASLSKRGTYMALGDEKEITAQRNGDDSYTVGVGLRLPENSCINAANIRSDISTQFSDWAPEIREIVEKSAGDFRAWPLYAMPPEQLSWKPSQGVTLVGDAAHVTTPFEGEGVNCALFDSLQLAQQIKQHGLEDLETAVEQYEKLMLPRGADLIRRSARNGELLFAHDAPQSFTRLFEQE